MKKFFVKAAALLLLVAVTAVVVVLLPMPANTNELAIIDKRAALAAAPSPKLVLAGGSNLAFGVDSEAVEDAVGMPVINMGLQAGFGLGRILASCMDALNAGDILVIAPEYDHFVNRWNGDEFAYELAFDAKQYDLLWPGAYYGFPTDFPTYLRIKFLSLIPRPVNPLANARAGFNAHGDYIKHLSLENQTVQPKEPFAKISEQSLTYFQRVLDELARRGVTVLLSYPSFRAVEFDANAALISALDRRLRALDHLTVISTPAAYRFPPDLFYDTVYHLNAAGRAERTRRLVADLREAGVRGVE